MMIYGKSFISRLNPINTMPRKPTDKQAYQKMRGTILQPKTGDGPPAPKRGKQGEKTANKTAGKHHSFYGRAATGHRYWKIRDSLGRWSTIKGRDIEYLEPAKKKPKKLKKETTGKETRKGGRKKRDYGEAPTVPLKEQHYYIEKIKTNLKQRFHLVYNSAAQRKKILAKLFQEYGFESFKSGPIGQKAKTAYALAA